MHSCIHDETTCPENLETVSTHTGNNSVYNNCEYSGFATYIYFNANKECPVFIGYKTGNIKVFKYI